MGCVREGSVYCAEHAWMPKGKKMMCILCGKVAQPHAYSNKDRKTYNV
jgi:hypothetical protein|tara:strand:+ start:425 stop:568 length:144 start_codon:yes stop_codon:yes gene_type:complete